MKTPFVMKASALVLLSTMLAMGAYAQHPAGPDGPSGPDSPSSPSGPTPTTSNELPPEGADLIFPVDIKDGVVLRSSFEEDTRYLPPSLFGRDGLDPTKGVMTMDHERTVLVSDGAHGNYTSMTKEEWADLIRRGQEPYEEMTGMYDRRPGVVAPTALVKTVTHGYTFMPSTAEIVKTTTHREITGPAVETYDPSVDRSAWPGSYPFKETKKIESTLVGEGLKYNTRIDLQGVHFMDRNFITREGLNADNDKVHNVANGDINETSTDAINGGQFHPVKITVEKYLDYKNGIDANDMKVLRVADGDITDKSTDAINGSQLHPVKMTVDKYLNIDNGIDANDMKVRRVAAGDINDKSTDAINGSQLHPVKKTVDKYLNIDDGIDANSMKVRNVAAGDIHDTSTDAVNGSQLHKVDLKVNNLKVKVDTYLTDDGITADNKKITNVADGAIAPGSKDAINGGQLDEALKPFREIFGGSDELGEDGNVILNVNGGSVTEGSTDAINGGQLFEEMKKSEEARNQINHRMNKVGAMSAALAGLHPLEYDERHKVTVSAAYGNYRNGHAVAGGIFVRPDHRSMLSAGFAVANGGESTFNVGASLRIGAQKNEYASTFKDFASSEVAHQLTIKLRHVDETVREQGEELKAQKQVLKAHKADVAQKQSETDVKIAAMEKRIKQLEALVKRLEAQVK